MHALIATDGTLDEAMATRFGSALAGPEGLVTVLTVIEVNRNMLRDLRAIYGERHPPHIDQDAEYVGISPQETGSIPGWPGGDEMISRYLDQQRDGRTADLADALRKAGVNVDVLAIEGEARQWPSSPPSRTSKPTQSWSAPTAAASFRGCSDRRAQSWPAAPPAPCR